MVVAAAWEWPVTADDRWLSVVNSVEEAIGAIENSKCSLVSAEFAVEVGLAIPKLRPLVM